MSRNTSSSTSNDTSASDGGDACAVCHSSGVVHVTRMVRWVPPCRCAGVLCQSCCIDFLMDHRLQNNSNSPPPPPLQCPTCQSPIAGHEYVTVGHVDDSPQAKATSASSRKKRTPEDSSSSGDKDNDDVEPAAATAAATVDNVEQLVETAVRNEPQPKKARHERPKTKDTAVEEAAWETNNGDPPAKRKFGPRKLPIRTSDQEEDGETNQEQAEGAGTADDSSPPAAQEKRGRPRTRPPKLPKRGSHTPFSERLQQLQEFRTQHGHAAVPFRYPANQSLAYWVKDMRRGSLKCNAEQRKQLDGVGFVWETDTNRKDREWIAQFDKLKIYQQVHGNCRVPWQWREDTKLAEWTHTQRKQYRAHKLRADRFQKLDALGFAWWLGKGDVPSAPTDRGNWAKKQRAAAKLRQQQEQQGAALEDPPSQASLEEGRTTNGEVSSPQSSATEATAASAAAVGAT